MAVEDEEEQVCKVLEVGKMVIIIPVGLVEGKSFECVWEVTVRACCSSLFDAPEGLEEDRLVDRYGCLGGYLVSCSGVV